MHFAATQLARRSDLCQARRPCQQVGEARWAPTCFRLSPPLAAEPGYEAVQLSADSASALAELLQVLGCGEESAALTFDYLGRSCQERSLRSALAQIAADEREHQILLAGLSAALPQPNKDPSLEA